MIRYQHVRFTVACVALAMLAQSVRGLEIKCTVSDDAQTVRKSGIVTSGVPFAKGAVTDLKKLSVSVGGKVVPAQFIKLAPWGDGSIRWALLDCQADVAAGGKAELLVRDDGGNKAPAQPVKADVTDAAVNVSTGPLSFTIDRKAFNLIKSLKVDGKELITGKGKGLVIYKEGGGEVVAAAPESVTLEQVGPMKAIVCVRGKFPGVHNDLMQYTVRIAAYAGQKFLKLHAWLENSGAHGYYSEKSKKKQKPEWFAFDGMAIELGLGLGASITAKCEGVESAGKFKVLQTVKAPKDRKQIFYSLKDFEYAITSGDKALGKGQKTDGVVALSGDAGKLTFAVRHFWQQYEKAVELDGTTLKAWLWPKEGLYPRSFMNHPCPGYATKMMNPLRKKGVYNMPGSVHKGHEMILDFSGRDAKESSAELTNPLFALASAKHYASTEAAPGLFTPPEVRTDEDECNEKLDAWINMTRSAADPKHKSSIWFARSDRKKAGAPWDTGFWYGWMDFGDFAVPGSAAVSLHNEWIWIMGVNAMRTGDLNFLRLMGEMSRHRLDVDQQWSDRDMPHTHGFQRVPGTYAHFHCTRFTRGHPNVGSNWLAGVALYYMMTGEPKALECMNRSIKAIPLAWERILKSKDYHVRQIPGNMSTVTQTMFSYIAMHALTGEKKYLDSALTMFQKCVIPRWKSLGPHLHARQQFRSQTYVRADQRYCYALHIFCLLHHLTGDEKLFELLKAGCEKDFPENFFDAPLFLADLHAYVSLKGGEDEQGHIEDGVEHWIEAFPASKCPPVYMPKNSQWTRRRAMFLRTGHLLQYYYWKKKDGKKE